MSQAAFTDQVTIFVRAGDGGDGKKSFRREKFVAHGGPDGGDGGNGGDIYMIADENCYTLFAYSRRSHFEADAGVHGQNSRKHGKNGQDLYLKVPPGTLVYEKESGDLLGDLLEVGDECLVARGGKGGRGNARFATAQRRTPGYYEKKEVGEDRWLRLELQLVADVGIIGFPNAGKSTLLSCLTNADPKVANYPFTTINPNLGVLRNPEYERLTLADMPGLIEGAAEGVGLGHQFLRHIERTQILLHLMDLEKVDLEDPMEQYDRIRHELEQYGRGLDEKLEILAINKVELEELQEPLKVLRKEAYRRGLTLFEISCAERLGLDPLCEELFARVKEVPPVPRRETIELSERYSYDYQVYKEQGVWMVDGQKIRSLLEQTDIDEEDSLRSFQRKLLAWGVQERLQGAGAKPGDDVCVGDLVFEFTPVVEWDRDAPAEPEEPSTRPSQQRRLEEKRRLKSLKERALSAAPTRRRGKKKRL